MIKVYQIFLDGASGWCTTNPSEFREEIICNYFTECNRDIPSSDLNLIMSKIRHMEIGDNIKFKSLKFYCFEMEEDEFNTRKIWGDF